MKPGYKQTEVGVIPEDWEVANFAELFTITAGGDMDPKRSAPECDQVHRYPIYSNALTNAGLYGYCSYADHPADSITVTARGMVGFANYRSEAYTAIGRVLVLKPKAPCDCRYFAEVTNTRVHFANESTGVPQLTAPQISKYSLPLPPLPEQRAIAEALSDVDGLLGGLDRLIAKKRDLKQAAMQQLLTAQTRLPGFHGEWQRQALKAFVSQFIVPMRDKPRSLAGDIPWCRIEDFDGMWLNSSRSGQGVHAETVRAMNLKVFPQGTLLVSCSADLGRCAIVARPLVTNQTFIGLLFDNQKADAVFFYYLMTSLATDLNNLSSGTTISYLSREQFEDYVVHVPTDRKEQTAIAEVLGEMDGELAALERRREKTRALKQAMMQQLLTGQTRLVSPAASNVIPVDFTAPAPAPAPVAPAVAALAEKKHNWAINEAVVVAVLVKHFGSEKFPLGRKRCTKLSYLLHRHVEHVAQGYLKKAAGPYNPAVKYQGPEGIAQKNGYIRTHKSGTFSGYVAADKIAQAERYFAEWYGPDVLSWLEQFRFKSNDDLERLATVDMAMEELRRTGTEISLGSVRTLIASEPEWVPKLDRSAFSDPNITSAIQQCRTLFPA